MVGLEICFLYNPFRAIASNQLLNKLFYVGSFVTLFRVPHQALGFCLMISFPYRKLINIFKSSFSKFVFSSPDLTRKSFRFLFLLKEMVGGKGKIGLGSESSFIRCQCLFKTFISSRLGVLGLYLVFKKRCTLQGFIF